MKKEPDYTKSITWSFGCLSLIFFIGYLMNFQNIWQYWPTDNLMVNATVQWFMSVIGVFCPPIGGITGWIW